MQGSPSYRGPVQRNTVIDDMAANHCYEIVRWPAYYSDAQCMNFLRHNTNPNVVHYVAMMHGITPLITVGQFKSFVATFEQQKKNKRHLPVKNNVKKIRKKQEQQLRDLRKERK